MKFKNVFYEKDVEGMNEKIFNQLKSKGIIKRSEEYDQGLEVDFRIVKNPPLIKN
ncbi:MAG: hypothetical protein ACRCXQ_07190 [Vagococcus fluvialis]